jgi:hypothetical protein
METVLAHLLEEGDVIGIKSATELQLSYYSQYVWINIKIMESINLERARKCNDIVMSSICTVVLVPNNIDGLLQ